MQMIEDEGKYGCVQLENEIKKQTSTAVYLFSNKSSSTGRYRYRKDKVCTLPEDEDGVDYSSKCHVHAYTQMDAFVIEWHVYLLHFAR